MKEKIVAGLQERLRGAKAVVVSHFQGLSVEEVNELRKRLRQAGVSHTVVKNTLSRLAARQAGYDGLLDFLQGPVALSISQGDIAAPARVLVAFAKEHEKFKVLGAVLEGKPATAQDILVLSSLPSRQELLAKLLVSLQSQLAGLARVLQGTLAGLVRALHAMAQQKAAST